MAPRRRIFAAGLAVAALTLSACGSTTDDGAKVADKPIGEWNQFRILMQGEKVSIYLNNELVTPNVTLENYWDRKIPIFPTGQIELQNHGNTLYFKNIYLRELPAK